MKAVFRKALQVDVLAIAGHFRIQSSAIRKVQSQTR
jgi:hypothetical protein